MSSFIVDYKTINIIVSGLVEANNKTDHYPGISHFTSLMHIQDTDGARDAFGQDMYSMNVEAVVQRYPDCVGNPNNMPGPVDENNNHAPYKYRFELPPKTIQFYKSLSCFLYQCSEGNVPETPLYLALDKYNDALAHHIAYRHPEYDKTTWG